MFKQVVPVLGLILLAGPVFAADTPPADPSAASSTTKSTTTKKHHSGKKHHKEKAAADASAPSKSSYVEEARRLAGLFVSISFRVRSF